MVLPSILKNYFTVSSGVAIGQVLSLIAMPVLSRLYSANSFGVLGTFLSIAAILGSLSTLQYSVALMLPKRDTEAANLFMVGCLSVTIITIIISTLSAIFPGLILSLMKASINNYLLLLLPLFVFFNGTNQMLIGWSVRRKQFRQNSTSQVVRSLTVNSAQIAAVPIAATGVILVTGAVLGELGSCINLGYAFWNNERHFFRRCFSTSLMRQLAKSYYDFPAFSTPQSALNALSQGLPVLMLGYYYGAAAAGLYAFGIRLVQAPLGLILNPLRQVLFQKFCELQAGGLRIFPAYCKSSILLAAIIVIPLLIGMLAAPVFFATIFGEKWREAGEFARWLLLWQAFLFCNVPSILMARILRMQLHLLLFDVATLGLRALVLVIGGIYWRDTLTVAVFGVMGAFLNLLLIAWIWLRVKRAESIGAGVVWLNEGHS